MDPSKTIPQYKMPDKDSPTWSHGAKKMFRYLKEPWQRRPLTEYRFEDLERYVPNESCLMPNSLASELAKLGKNRALIMHSQSAKAVAWNFFREFALSSSLLDEVVLSVEEANTLFSRDTYEWDHDEATLKQNLHAIKCTWIAAAYSTLHSSFIRQAHTYAMVDLLPPRHLGKARSIITRVGASTYRPLNNERMLDEMLDLICTKAAAITNTIEASFFLWLHIAYLQPFLEGNRRTSRVVANFPLIKAKYTPLTFTGVRITDYQSAMIAFYETGDVAIAADLFEWSYRRAAEKYAGMEYWGRQSFMPQSTD